MVTRGNNHNSRMLLSLKYLLFDVAANASAEQCSCGAPQYHVLSTGTEYTVRPTPPAQSAQWSINAHARERPHDPNHGQCSPPCACSPAATSEDPRKEDAEM